MIISSEGDLVLEGLYHKGTASPQVVVAAPHPRYGGSMHSPVVAEIAFAAARDSHPAMRFNYRGVGGSQGVSSGTLAEAADFRAALEELTASSGMTETVAAGYSYGATIALEVALNNPGVVALVLVAPPASLLDWEKLGRLRMPSLIAAGTADPSVDLARIRSLSLPAMEVVEIPQANHVFDLGLLALGRAVQGFLQRFA